MILNLNIADALCLLTHCAMKDWSDKYGVWSTPARNLTSFSHCSKAFYLLTCTCVGIHPGRVESASPTALTTPRTEALHARRSCASSLDSFTQSFLHRAWPKTRGPEIGSRSALIVVAHVFSWPPVCLRHVRGGVGIRRSLIRSTSGRLAACPNQRSLLCLHFEILTQHVHG